MNKIKKPHWVEYFLAVFVLFSISTQAYAEIYSIFTGNFNYLESTSITGTIETNQKGEFLTETEIENFFNSSTYSISFKNGSTELFNLNNTNSTWDIEFSSGSDAKVNADSNQISLDFLTPNQPSSVVLKLGSPTTGLVQFRQENNISDYNFINADYNAVHQATQSLAYESTFIIPAIQQTQVSAVPAPPAIYLFISGLGFLLNTKRKSRK